MKDRITLYFLDHLQSINLSRWYKYPMFLGLFTRYRPEWGIITPLFLAYFTGYKPEWGTEAEGVGGARGVPEHGRCTWWTTLSQPSTRTSGNTSSTKWSGLWVYSDTRYSLIYYCRRCCSLRRCLCMPPPLMYQNELWCSRSTVLVQERNWYNRKQCVLVLVPVLDQCQHFHVVLYFLFAPCTGLGVSLDQC